MLKLQVVVSNHCLGCVQAIELSSLAAERFRDLSVDVVNLDDRPHAKPPQAVAIPAYILDGSLLFLGNPSLEDLLEKISKRMRELGTEE